MPVLLSTCHNGAVGHEAFSLLTLLFFFSELFNELWQDEGSMRVCSYPATARIVDLMLKSNGCSVSMINIIFSAWKQRN